MREYNVEGLKVYLKNMMSTRKGKQPIEFANKMLSYLEVGRKEFTSSDFTETLKIHLTSVNEYLRELKKAGLLEMVDTGGNRKYYRLVEKKPETTALQEDQKNTLKLLYELFREETFSTEMVVAQLNYSEGQASGILDQFTMLKLLDCTPNEDNSYSYQLNVNPEDNPECFEDVA